VARGRSTVKQLKIKGLHICPSNLIGSGGEPERENVRFALPTNQFAAEYKKKALGKFQRALHALLPPRCPGCERPAVQPGLCLPCMRSLRPPDDAFLDSACFLYTGILAQLIRRAKFMPSPALAAACLPIWGEAVLHQRFHRLREESTVITFVPSHWRRRLWRGFNLASLLAMRLSKTWGKPCTPLLRCLRFHAPLAQTIDRESRKELVRDRFQMRPNHIPQETKILVIDDVMTTGSTLSEIERVLEASGYRPRTLVLAQTPQHIFN
jgi:predicted amidophosphoribosyltransferase